MNNKKTIIIISIMVIVLIGIVSIVVVKNSKSNKSSTNISENIGKEEIVKESKFSFIYNYNELSDDWWNTINSNSNWKSIGYTNRNVFEKTAENCLGNISGKLSVRPVDFIEYFRIGNEYYKLDVNNNTFLIPQQIKILDNNNSSDMIFYILGSDLYPYEVKLVIEDIPDNIQLNDGKWEIMKEENYGEFHYNAYYPINKDYCLKLEFPNIASEDKIKSMNENTKDYYMANHPYNQDDLNELVNKTVKIFSLRKIDSSSVGMLSFNVKLNDIKLGENTIVNLNNLKMITWHSGAEHVAAKKDEGDSFIVGHNSNNERIFITEYSKEQSVEMLLSYWNFSKKEYTYKNRKIYIVYNNDNSSEKERGKYYGILFNIDNTWYMINESTTVNPETINIDEWIDSMCKDVIIFK